MIQWSHARDTQMPVYIAHYETGCMTRQQLEQLVAEVAAASSGPCSSRQCFASMTGGRLVWVFDAPDRAALDDWLVRLRLANHQWLMRVEYEGDGGAVKAT
jgi:hypothetical protein